MDYFTIMLLVILAAFVAGWYRDYSKRKRRRASLRHVAETNMWVWIELDGTERQSPIHPDAPGGAWADSDGGDGDGGD